MVFLYNIIRTSAVGHIHDAVAVFIGKGNSGITQNLSRTELCEVGMVFEGVFLAPVHGIAYLHIQVVVAPFGVVHRFYAFAACAYFSVFQSTCVVLLVLYRSAYLHDLSQLHTRGIIDELNTIAIGIANNAGQVEVIVCNKVVCQ